ncbi:CRAL-TRIO domain-containing protein [Rhodofomes roseus]|uniref:Phosphatidylinositol transfer protein SFH5 n=1 Tax=Rhodofomes roseus TaxID=34475 RepID=A0ABQ8K0B0_9APHY|nr:CRAL-TRIO domain-containing protein [Rhodofomes roseus]KAH9830031.1 CRAL-TRIO domain-containing protein [Rhodofomes roseus]
MSDTTPAPDTTTPADTAPAPEVAAAVPIPETPAPGADAGAADSQEKKGDDDAGDEPQNTLTRKFSDAEWTAVKELRAQLPEIFAEAYAAKEDKQAPVTLWGVQIDPASPKDARVSVVLIKFLRARDLKVAEARKMLTDTLKWREDFKLAEVLKEEFPEKIFGGLGKIYGKSKDGHPVVYNIYGGSDVNAVFGDVDRFLRWRVAFMEKCIEELDFENVDQMVQIHDYEGVSMMSRTPGQKAAASQASALFSSYYPELLSRKFFVNVPTVMAWVFWLFKALVPAKTMEKFSMVGTGPKVIGVELLPLVDAGELPKRYGGEALGWD